MENQNQNSGSNLIFVATLDWEEITEEKLDFKKYNNSTIVTSITDISRHYSQSKSITIM